MVKFISAMYAIKKQYIDQVMYLCLLGKVKTFKFPSSKDEIIVFANREEAIESLKTLKASIVFRSINDKMPQSSLGIMEIVELV